MPEALSASAVLHPDDANQPLFEAAIAMLNDERDGLVFINNSVMQRDGTDQQPRTEIIWKFGAALVARERMQPVSAEIMPNVHAGI